MIGSTSAEGGVEIVQRHVVESFASRHSSTSYLTLFREPDKRLLGYGVMFSHGGERAEDGSIVCHGGRGGAPSEA